MWTPTPTSTSFQPHVIHVISDLSLPSLSGSMCGNEGDIVFSQVSSEVNSTVLRYMVAMATPCKVSALTYNCLLASALGGQTVDTRLSLSPPTETLQDFYQGRLGMMHECKGQHIGKAPSLHLFHTTVRQDP